MDNENSNDTSSDVKQDTIKDNPSENNTQPAQTNDAPTATFNTPDFDISELTRKLDGIIQTQSVISKAIAQIMTNGGSHTPEATSTTRPTSDALPTKDINELDI